MSIIRVPRTVSQIPLRRAGRVAHVLPRPDIENLPPLAAAIAVASSNRRRAEIVLRAPDAVLLAHGEAMAGACRQTGFDAGAQFIAYRLEALHATRRADGALPAGIGELLALWRNGLVAAMAEPRDPLATQADQEGYEGQV